MKRITVAEILLTSSLRYITATVQSVGLNIIPVAVFVLAVLAGREKFVWGSVYGQAKLWGVFAAAAGASLVVLASDSDSAGGGEAVAFEGFWAGVLMVAVAVLVHSVAYLLVVNQNAICVSRTFCILPTISQKWIALFASFWKILGAANYMVA
jgi:hypothetical protein